MVIFFSAALGLVVGSFLNVVMDRGARGETIRGRSRCESCQTTLTKRELIPIFSFLIQKRRCRNCGSTLSWQYPLVEGFTACFYALAAGLIISGHPLDIKSAGILLAVFLIISAAIVIFVSDLRFRIIPTGPNLVLLFLGLLLVFLRFSAGGGVIKIFYDTGAAFLISIFLAALWFISQGRWMGLGDAKLILATSLITGFPAALVSFLFSFWLGGVTGIILILAHKKTLQNKIPFGPFILIGAGLAYFFSQNFLMVLGWSNLYPAL